MNLLRANLVHFLLLSTSNDICYLIPLSLSLYTAEDFLCKRLVDMRGGIVDLGKQQAVQDQNHLNVDHQNQVSIKELIMLDILIVCWEVC